jgi:thiol-disulfide isomerase/thioredoxin
MKTIFLLLLLGGSGLRAEEATPPVPEAAPLTLDVLTLADGRTLAGRYDEAKSSLLIIDEKSGKSLGTITVKPGDIASRTTKAITVQPAAEAPKRIPPGVNGRWLTDSAVAFKLAKEYQRPVLALFTGSDWCPWCMKLQKEVFTTKEFRAWAAEKVVVLEIDFPRHKPLPAAQLKVNQEFAGKYGVTGYPTVMFLAADGSTLWKYGYAEGGAQAWITACEATVPALKAK